MKMQLKRGLLSVALAAALGATVPAVLAQTTTVEQQIVVIDQTAASQPTRAAQNMAPVFAEFVGSETDSLALIEGLRSGSTITLEGDTDSVTITPNAPMGYGNVFATLALAQEDLAQAGITEPTAEELATALNGGSITVNGVTTQFAGVLTLRASGMGWGQIAKELGVNLGRVISSLRSGNERLASAGDARNSHGRSGEKAAKAEKAEKAEKGSGASASGRTHAAERAERVTVAEHPVRVERAERPERVERPERPERVERPERPERPDRPEKPERR